MDAVVAVIAFVSGSAATLIPKVLLRSDCDALCARPGPFSAPISASCAVYVAAVCGLVGELLMNECRKRYPKTFAATHQSEKPLLVNSDANEADEDIDAAPHTTLAPQLSLAARGRLLMLPSILASISLVMQLAALQYVNAAILAGLRGAYVLFGAVLSAFFRLGDAPRGVNEWLAVFASALGAALVGVAAVLEEDLMPASNSGTSDDEGSSSTGPVSALVGAALSVCGYALAAIQAALEQRLLEGKGLSRLTILGTEGAIGLAISAALLGGGAALADYAKVSAPIEDVARSACCVTHTPILSAWATCYGIASLTFNTSLLALSASAGMNTRVLLFTARGVLTWALESALYYIGEGGAKSFGARITPFAALIVSGYALLIGSGLRRAALTAARQKAETVAATR